jgi:hypothetical protein
MGLDGLLAGALALVAGGTWSLSPAASSAGFVVAALLSWPALGRRRLLACGLLFGAGALRSVYWLDHYDQERWAFRDAIGHPRRCAFTATVGSSPVEAHGGMSFLANVSQADCEGVPMPPFRARVYGGSATLARGDHVSGVADFAAAQLFRNFGVADPRPSGARSGAVASGGALSLLVENRGFGIKNWIDRALGSKRRFRRFPWAWLVRWCWAKAT